MRVLPLVITYNLKISLINLFRLLNSMTGFLKCRVVYTKQTNYFDIEKILDTD